jgi:hypothetical protein
MNESQAEQAQRNLEEAEKLLYPEHVPYYLHAHHRAAIHINERQTPPSRSQPNTGGDVSDQPPS